MKRSFALSLLAALALCACGKEQPASSAASTSATPAAASTAAASTAPVDAATATLTAGEPPLPDLGEFKIFSVLLGSAVDEGHVVIVDTRQLAANQPIYASVLSICAHQGLKLSADWIAPDGHSFAKSEQPIVPDSDLATTFKVENPTGWPAGDYQLRIAINGHTVNTEAFTVQ
jgi:hypothetical protein